MMPIVCLHSESLLPKLKMGKGTIRHLWRWEQHTWAGKGYRASPALEVDTCRHTEISRPCNMKTGNAVAKI